MIVDRSEIRNIIDKMDISEDETTDVGANKRKVMHDVDDENALPKSRRNGGEDRSNHNFNVKPINEEGYTEGFNGPFNIWVKNKKNDEEFDIIKVAKAFVDKYESVIEVRRSGRFKAVVSFGDRIEANKSLHDEEFKKIGMIVFILGFSKFRKGVVKDIPLDFNMEELKDAIESPCSVHNVIRLNRRNRNSSTESSSEKWIPTSSVLITFNGEILPKEVKIFYVKTKVEPYVKQPMQCFNCFRFGHMAKSCRGKKKCARCGELDHPDDKHCTGITPRCANCKQSHISISSDCPVFEKHRLVNELVAYDNFPYSLCWS